MPFYKKILISLLIITISVFLFLYGNKEIPYFDKKASEYFSTNIEKALITYGTFRILNGIISVLQESNISIEPGGVGLEVAVGQCLDPINDIIERGSNLLESTIIALGVLKISYEFSKLFLGKILGILLFLLAFLYLLPIEKIQSISQLLVKVVIILIIFRIALPTTAYISNYINEYFFNKRIIQVQKQLEPFKSEQDSILSYNFDNNQEESGLFSSIKSLMAKLSPVIYVKKVYSSLKFFVKNIGKIVNLIVKLSILYVGKFIFEVIMIPILTFYFLLKLIDNLLETEYSKKYKNKIAKSYKKKELKKDENLEEETEEEEKREEKDEEKDNDLKEEKDKNLEKENASKEEIQKVKPS